MSDLDDKKRCTQGCIGMGVVAGVLATILSVMFSDIGWNGSIFIGVLVAGVLSVAFLFLFCRAPKVRDPADLKPRPVGKKAPTVPASAPTSDKAEASDAGTLHTVPDPKPTTAAGGGPAGPATVPDEPRVKPSKELKGQEELAARKGEWKYEGTSAKTAAAAPAAVAAAPASAAEESAPALLDAPRGGKGDDLKLISGVGPKLEETLNELGVWHFDQVAQWGPSEIAWVDSRLRFKGRIERDDWMSQAKILAEGGETEFSRKKKT